MPTPNTSRRDWSRVDFYAVLGVAPRAGRKEIERAFRQLAKQLHPDRNVGSPYDPSAERFKEVSAAYDVLGDPATRVRYDDLRASSPGAPSAPSVGRRPVITPRRARQMVVGGVAVLVLGLLSTALVVSLQRRDSEARASLVTVTARRLPDSDRIEFRTSEGRRIVTAAPDVAGLGTGNPGAATRIRYDPADPSDVVSAADTTARDITLWIVSIKLLVGGTAFTVLGATRLRRGSGGRAGRLRPASM